jgi:hypothetical protein
MASLLRSPLLSSSLSLSRSSHFTLFPSYQPSFRPTLLETPHRTIKTVRKGEPFSSEPFSNSES